MSVMQNTMRYKKECHEHLKANGKVKTKEKDTVSYPERQDLIHPVRRSLPN